MKRLIRVSFDLPYTRKQRKGWWLASCDSLDVHSQGSSEAEAVENLREALAVFLASCIRRGTLERVLRDAGYSATPKPQRTATRRQTLDVPVYLTASDSYAQAGAD